LRKRRHYRKDVKRAKVVGYFHNLSPDGERPLERDLCDLKDFDFSTIMQVWAEKYFEIQQETHRRAYSFGELSERYLMHIQKTRKRNTLDTYESSIVRFLDIAGDTTSDQFTPEMHDNFLASLKHFANATQRKHCTAVNMFLKWADEISPHGIRIKLPKKRKKHPKIFLDEEYEVLLSHIKKRLQNAERGRGVYFVNHLRALVMMRETGMRRGEVWSLPYRHISKDFILIEDNTELEEDIKGGDASGVMINDRLKSFLDEDRKYAFETQDYKRKFFLSDGKGGLIFKRKDSITQALSRHAKDAGLDPEAKICHGHRATLITKIIDKYGVAEAQDIARHKSEQTTLGYLDKSVIRRKQKKILNEI